MINSYDAIEAISEVRGNAIVVSIMTPNRYFEKLSKNKDLDLPVFGAMGKASNIALGISIARPDKKVFVLDGDGSLLMNAGSLVTELPLIIDMEGPIFVNLKVFNDSRDPGMYMRDISEIMKNLRLFLFEN